MSPIAVRPQRWMRRVLALAAAYHITWAALAIGFPGQPYAWAGVESPLDPAVWRVLGLLMGCLGVGFGIAAFNPTRHWAIVFIGLVSKILGPLGFVLAASQGSLPWSAGVSIPIDDLIWLPPFALILREAYRRHHRESDAAEALPRDRAILKHMSQRGYTLFELSQDRPVLAVFLRHAGCTFCREALADLSRARPALEARGVTIALAHMTPGPQAEEFFAKYGLQDVDRFADPDCELYRALGLRRATFGKLFAPAVWLQGIRAGVFEGHGLGAPVGDAFRMPGAFLIEKGSITRSHRPAGVAFRLDYLQFVGDLRLPSATANS